MPAYGDPPDLMAALEASLAPSVRLDDQVAQVRGEILAEQSGMDRATPWTHPRTLTDSAQPVTVEKPKASEGTVSNLLRRNVGNLPVRVPACDWSKVVTGEKSMFRAYSERGGDRLRPLVPADTIAPRPCLLYAVRPGRRWEAIPGVLMSHHQEPLGAITEDDLYAEGFEHLHDFKWAWKDRYRTLGWRPLDMVSVLEVRPQREDDETWVRDWLFDQAYGEWS